MARKKVKEKPIKICKPKILVICDGETECNYVRGFIEETVIKHYFDIKYSSGKTDTKSIMKEIKATYHIYEYIFALSDKDNINNQKDLFNEFCQLNQLYDNVISGYSNPCFELWLYLHHNYRETSISIKDLDKKAKQYFGENYKINRNLYKLCRDHLNTSINHSIKLKEVYDLKLGKYSDFVPITNVDEIITVLREINEGLLKKYNN